MIPTTTMSSTKLNPDSLFFILNFIIEPSLFFGPTMVGHVNTRFGWGKKNFRNILLRPIML